MSNLSRESIRRVLSDCDMRIFEARARLGKALFGLQCRINEVMPVNVEDMTWSDLARSLPADLGQLETRLRRAELAIFEVLGAFEYLQVRQRQKVDMTSAAAKRARP